jgi:hypothetical protein
MLRLQGMFAQRRQITSEVEVSLLVVSFIIDIRYPALAVSRVNTWRTRYEGAGKLTCISYENEQPSVSCVQKQTSFDAPPKKHTIFRAANNECGWLLQSAEIGCSGRGGLVLILVVFPKFILVWIVSLSKFQQSKISVLRFPSRTVSINPLLSFGDTNSSRERRLTVSCARCSHASLLNFSRLKLKQSQIN